ncbi:hypothetical protein [Sorangium sp. So ce693]|uniref:hypothetical protein n=1 Tax=Sorangium sp. So ce693 TaxID=3133318 RepID=UPI003F62DAF4
MFDQFTLKGEFFATLEALDRAIAQRVAASWYPACGGPLHAGNYPRKPRSALIAAERDAFVVRFSFCCGREGSRRPAGRFGTQQLRTGDLSRARWRWRAARLRQRVHASGELDVRSKLAHASGATGSPSSRPIAP